MRTPIYHKYDHRKNLTLYWRQYFPNYQIPKGYHVHHIKPKSICKQKGWKDERINHPSNLIALHPDDHHSVHKCRGDIVTCNFIKIIGHQKGKKSTRRNYTHSKETRNKISKANKGNPSPKGMLGKYHSANTKEKISKSSKGKKNTKEAIAKMKETKGSEDWKIVKEQMKSNISKTKSDPNWIDKNSTHCPYCNRTINNKGMYRKYHGINCKANLPS